jgi:hypothetical protein
MKTEYQDVWDWRVENDNKPIWTRPPKVRPQADSTDLCYISTRCHQLSCSKDAARSASLVATLTLYVSVHSALVPYAGGV